MRRFITTSALFLTYALTQMDQTPLEAIATAQSPPNDFTTIAEKSIPAVVSIRTKVHTASPHREFLFPFLDPFGNDFFHRFFGLSPKKTEVQPIIEGLGSGFIVSSDGYIMTNSHVIRGADTIQVTLSDGRAFSGRLIGQDPNTDVAICKIEASSLPTLPLGNSQELKVGQWSIAVGNPLGLQASLTVGVISAKGRDNLNIAALEDFIQTDTAINRGNSGGPLLNANGEVIGMNTAIASNTGGYMGIGFAIPIDLAKNIMEQLIQKGSVSRGFLGVVLQPIDYDIAQAFGLNEVAGALVAEVREGSPASRSGLREGDIIISFDGHSIDNVGHLRNDISLMHPGTKITLKLIRNRKEETVVVEVGSYPQPIEKSGEKQEPKKRDSSSTFDRLGIEVKDLTKELATTFDIPYRQAAVVSDVNPNGLGQELGLTVGTIILEVNQTKITSTQQIKELLNGASRSEPILLLLRQHSLNRFVAFRIP